MLLTAIYGLGFVAGSLSGSRGGEPAVLKRRFLGGLALMGAGFLACAIAPGLAAAARRRSRSAGLGNGLLLVYERLLIQTTVDDALMAASSASATRLSAWAFAAAFLAAGALHRGVRRANGPRDRGRGRRSWSWAVSRVRPAATPGRRRAPASRRSG